MVCREVLFGSAVCGRTFGGHGARHLAFRNIGKINTHSDALNESWQPMHPNCAITYSARCSAEVISNPAKAAGGLDGQGTSIPSISLNRAGSS